MRPRSFWVAAFLRTLLSSGGLAMAGLLAGHDLAVASASTIDLGRGGWIVERFAPDTAVLRTPLSQPTSGSEADMLLTCAGHDRRLRLRLPRAAVPARKAPGMALLQIAPIGAITRKESAFLPTVLPDVTTLNYAGSATERDPLIAIARFLLDTPRGLDVTQSLGRGPVAFTHLVVYRLRVARSQDDAASIRTFLAACGATSSTR